MEGINYQIVRIENLHLADRRRTGICQITVLGVVDREGAEARGIRGRVAYRVQHLHVPNVVYVEGFLQTYHQTRPKHEY